MPGRVAATVASQPDSQYRTSSNGTVPTGNAAVAVGSLRYHALVSELAAGDTQDVIRHGGQAVAVVVPIEEYQQLRQAVQEQQVNEEFDAARADYLARRGGTPSMLLITLSVNHDLTIQR